jgi:hypothetical protein
VIDENKCQAGGRKEKMSDFKEGQSVRVRVQDVQPGPLDEKLVTIRTGRPVNLSGFVKEKFLQERGDQSFINGQVVGVTADTIYLKLPVSFFTAASGVASMPREWATANVEAD